jgi:diguanylate cyclase (GGDEF)-like protein
MLAVAAQLDADQYEQLRLAALDRYDVLDSPSEQAFERIMRMARAIFEVPIAAVTLIDGHRQWVKSQHGLGTEDTPKCDSFCNVAIRQDRPLVVADTWVDDRFKANPLVQGPPYVRFYAGAQLWTPDNFGLGALCLIDTKPRQFSAEQVALLRDLADVVVSELEAQRLSMTDSLTGILSRHGFRREAKRAVSLAVRHGHPLSCIAFDIDHFKAVNDGHGHAAGDKVLREVSAACGQRLRSTDVFGRVGGEEFAVALPHTNAADAMQVAEQLRATIDGMAFKELDAPLGVSASFGVASLERPGVNLDELLRRADTALYAAKNAGRNRCELWQAPPDSNASAIMRRVFKAGQIAFNGGRSTIDCTVRNLSDSGANIEVVSFEGIPESFKLLIPADGISRHCKIVGRGDRRLEVAFD